MHTVCDQQPETRMTTGADSGKGPSRTSPSPALDNHGATQQLGVTVRELEFAEGLPPAGEGLDGENGDELGAAACPHPHHPAAAVHILPRQPAHSF